MKQLNTNKSIYSKFEMGFMTKFNQIKSRIFHPLIVLLDHLHITANFISVFSALVAVSSLIYAIYFDKPYVFLIGIWIHMLVDGIDGSLARYQKKDSKKGALIDVIFDHMGITSSVIFGIYFMLVNSLNIGIYLGLYTFIIIISLFLLFKNSQNEIIFRPRFYIYLTLVIDSIYFINLTNIFVLISNVFMFFGIVFGLIKIKSLYKK